MPTSDIPWKYQLTAALKARYIEGWQDGVKGREHAYTNEVAVDAFKRLYGTAQLRAYSAGYEAAVSATLDNAR